MFSDNNQHNSSQPVTSNSWAKQGFKFIKQKNESGKEQVNFFENASTNRTVVPNESNTKKGFSFVKQKESQQTTIQNNTGSSMNDLDLIFSSTPIPQRNMNEVPSIDLTLQLNGKEST